MEPLRLQEHVPSRGVKLAVEQRDALLASGAGIMVVPSPGTEDAYDLTPGSTVGSVRLPGCDIVICPKLAVERVLFLVSYAMRATRWRDEPFELGEADDVFAAIVPGFVHHLRAALRRGLVQGYRTTEEPLLTIRGRLRMADQLRRFGQLLPAEVTFDDYTVDTEMNRVLVAAIDRLLRLRLVPGEWADKLRALEAEFEGVERVEFGRRAPMIDYTRLNDRFEPACELARLVLRSTSFDLVHGEVAGRSFLVDMNRAFEDFLAIALDDELAADGLRLVRGASGRHFWLDEAGRVPLKPDLSLWAGSRCLFVGDAKYKKIEYEGYENADLYQLLAYTVAADLPGGLLVYAAGDQRPFCHRVVKLGKELDVMTLDLDVPPAQLLTQVRLVADRARGWVRAMSRKSADQFAEPLITAS
jgi:5-methylcytosine-specific restriction enzyme subunit McrC